MLSTEFYLLNATTLLLGLFQYCSHELLLLFLLLGVLVVIAGLFNLVFRIFKIGFSSVLDLVNYILRKLLVSLFIYSPRTSIVRNIPTFTNTILGRIISDSSSDSNNIPPLDRRLTLPQILALHPIQWSALEAINNSHTETNPSEHIESNNIPVQTVISSALDQNSLIPVLRRSRRLRRARNIFSS